MNFLNQFDLVTKNQARSDFHNILTANGFDPIQAVANMGKAHKELVGKADAARALAKKLADDANAARAAASNAAAEAFKKATGSKVDTTKLRAAAAALLAATDWFEKWDFTGLSQKYLNEVLAFAGMDTNVLAKMRKAAAEKRAEADRLDKLAAEATKNANTARADAEAKIAQDFKTSMGKVQESLANAVQFDALAASMFETYSRYGGK